MACNDNVVKNIANEVTRECQAKSCAVETEFVVYLIKLLLLNPKYGKLFEKTLNRNNLEYFVNECVDMLTSGDTATKTLRMQHILASTYDKPQSMIDRHLDHIDNCLSPLVTEILEEDPEPENEADMKKLFRKISIYIILASGLGNPGLILTLKEGMAALESVLSLEDLRVFLSLPRGDKLSQLVELLAIVSGVRLFNRDCKRGGDNIPDLPFELVDVTKACLASLSNSLVTVMQRVNSLTSAIEDSIDVQEETGNVLVNVPPNSDLTQENYTQIFALLVFNRQYEVFTQCLLMDTQTMVQYATLYAERLHLQAEEDYIQIFALLVFNRQYEVFTRRLLMDTQTMAQNATLYAERLQAALAETHAVLKYKAAVPVHTVFPLFVQLWQVWRAMQNEIYLVSTVSRLLSTLAGLQEQLTIPYHILGRMLRDKEILTDQERMSSRPTLEDRLSLIYLKNYVMAEDSGLLATKDSRHIQYLGFCALCLCAGALVPCNMKLGTIKHNHRRYGFCSVKMASTFSKDPQRYINEVLEYSRNNPHVINLLNVADDVLSVKDVDTLLVRYAPKIQVSDKEAQTSTHPVEEYIEKNYSWNLWEWKRRACQWANIVKCQTHSTQTDYSHLRSEIHCQTIEPRDKCQQTMKEVGVNMNRPLRFLWGLRGHLGDGQHSMDLTEMVDTAEKLKPRVFTACDWPCVDPSRELPARSEEGHKQGTDVPQGQDDPVDESEIGSVEGYKDYEA